VLAQVLAYGLFGCAVEYGFTLVLRRAALPSAWMIPLYGLAAILFPPLRGAVRDRPALVRAGVYGAAMLVAEYAIGRSLRAAFGSVPWTYTARLAVDGVTRLDYFPLWALYGLALERLQTALGEAANQRVGAR
jgi:hypothetical protein